VIAYEALLERYQWLKEQGKSLDQLNPLTLIDDLKAGNKNSNSQILGYHMDGQTIQRLYKGGRLPRSSHGNIGKVDIIGALEQSSNIYFSILASEHILDPNVLFQTTRQFGFGSPTGIEIPGEIAGNVPTDLAHNRTGLYAFAIGQHSLVVTPLQTASMLSTFVNHGQIVKPKVVQVVAGMEPTRDQDTLFTAAQYSFKEALDLVGIDFPLFTETLKQDPKPYVFISPLKSKMLSICLKKSAKPFLKGCSALFLDLAEQRAPIPFAIFARLLKSSGIMSICSIKSLEKPEQPRSYINKQSMQKRSLR